MLGKITDRQFEILKGVYAFVQQHSYCPTMREISSRFNITVKGAYDHLCALKRKGYVDWTEYRFRTLHLTDKGIEKCKWRV